MQIARIDGTKDNPVTQEINLTQAIAGAAQQLREMTEARQVDVRVAPDLPSITTDAARLELVLVNLLSNAIKYNRPQGRVTVSTEVNDDVVRIAVSDTGLGISPEMVERLFIPFDRLNIEATGIEGTGLGLALSKNLTEAMGGTLSFDSTPGKGSEFTIQLPIFKGQ